jgi:uncharacterized coiled-coil DUF342 family protein
MTAEETQAASQTETAKPAATDAKPAAPDAEVDVRNLQDKFHNLLDQRNHYNDLGRAARDARNLLNDGRRDKSETIDEHKKARDALNAEMKEHKELRNAYQDQAKALIGEKKGKMGGVERSLPLQVRKLRNEIQTLLEQQETTVLTPAKENALVDNVRAKRKELKELESQLETQKLVDVDLSDADGAIDDLFKRADAEHEIVSRLQKEAQVHHEKFVEAIKEVRTISAEADSKHKEFIAYKTKADEYHEKGMELREKVMAVKGERAEEYKAQKQEIRGFNDRARNAVSNPAMRKKVEDDALAALKSGGKISL